MQDIKNLDFSALQAWLSARKEPAFRAGQIFQWLYQKHAPSLDDMHNLSLDLRAHLAREFRHGHLTLKQEQVSSDGSKKYLFALPDGQAVETVLMPNRTHYTLCVSSQAGCAMGCAFCHTATLGLIRNLEPWEILGQVCHAARDLPPGQLLRNIVFMGMGEPLHNYRHLLTCLDTLKHSHGFGLSWRRITISTAGLVPAIKRLAAEKVLVQLAISLNGTDNETRGRLMPVNRRWSLEELLETCRTLPLLKRSKITFEYVLIAGITDSLAQAKALIKILHGLPAKVNLIPFNPWEGSEFRPPALNHARAFQKKLLDAGMVAPLRLSKGSDIQAACGQLAGSLQKAG